MTSEPEVTAGCLERARHLLPWRCARWRACTTLHGLVTAVVFMASLRGCTCEIHPSQAARDPGSSVHVSPAVLSSPRQLDRLDEFLQELMACRQVPGLTLSVVVGDQVALTREYGLADRRTDTPVTKETVFCVASLSKAFTSVLLAILLKRNGYTWDTKVYDILGDDFQLYDEYITHHVTIRDLLLHRTGVPRYDLLWFSGKMDKRQLLRHLRCLKPADDFRSKAIYNNILYMVAGHVTEVLGKGSWEDLIRSEILIPLEMNNTAFFHIRGDLADRFATQYVLHGGRHVELDYTKFSKGAEAIAPAIALCSTASDMTHWMEFLLSKGVYKHDRRLEYTDVMEEALTSQILANNVYYSQIQRPRTPVSLTLNTYGLAWLDGSYRGYPLLSHYGSFPGFLSMISLLRIYNIGIFTSINGGNQDLPYTINSLIHTYILDLLLGETPWIESGHYQDPRSEACFFPHDSYRDYTTVTPVNKSVAYWRPHDVYSGTYVSPIYTDLRVWREEEATTDTDGRYEVTLRLQYGALTFTLYPERRQDDVDVFVAVTDDRDWMIPSIHVHFVMTQNNDQYVVDAVDLPEFKSSSGGNIFTKVEPNSDGHYTCQESTTTAETNKITKTKDTVDNSLATTTTRHYSVFLLILSRFCVHISIS